MDSICRLCCSTNFVNNYLFDEENALNLKMELFFPIKVTKGDQLPQNVCNRCSCKVNDIYQFCNIAIAAQDRLRGMLLNISTNLNDSIDLTVTKRENLLPILPGMNTTDRGTQTDTAISKDEIDLESLKVEPKSRSPSPIKREECSFETEHQDVPDSILSDDSDDVSLIALKRRKRGRNLSTNGEAPVKRGTKKKGKLKELSMNTLPPIETNDNVLDKPAYALKADVKEETDFIGAQLEQKTTVKVKKTADIKKELNETDTYQCCICLRQCYSRNATLQHYREHVSAEREERPAPPPRPAGDAPRCVRCNKRVEGAGEAWAAHWARHWARDARPLRCALCEQAFRHPQQILKHGLTHAAGEAAPAPLTKRFVCDFCPEGFVYMRYLLAHRARAHASLAARPLRLRCGQCAREFAHLNSLRRHLRAHSGERNHLCSVCGKALSSREHLKFHLRIHSGYKPNVCKTCGKGFVKKCNLTLHERVHSGEKPHVCSHCGKAFSQRSTLVIHERYHSGARPYSCALCGRGFVAKGLLSMHLKTTCI